MKKLFLLAGVSIFLTHASFGDVLANWTFEADPLAANYLPGANTATTNFYADSGLQAGSAAAIGLHVGGATYSSPVGNGSAKSLSANTWAIGDYFQFQASTIGYSGVSIQYDQTGSATGPRDFILSYSLDGSSFTTFGSTYSVLVNASPNPVWNGTTSSGIYTLSYDLSSITALDNVSSVFFRVTDTSTTSINNGTVAAGGTDRVDNFTISATPVPEPTSIALGVLGGMAGLVWLRRRQ